MSGNALAALLKIQQCHFHVGRVALTRHPYKDMLDVQATVLPTPLVHTCQGAGQFLEYALVDQFAVAFTATRGVPVFNFVKTV